MQASKLLQEIRHSIRAVDDEIRRHPYLDALEQAAVEPEALKAFPGHEYHIVSSDLRSIATMVQRFDQPAARGFFNGVLQGEIAGLEGIVTLGRAMGMTEDELANYPVTPEGFAYATFMAWQSVYASAAEVACGFLVNFDAWGANCGRMSQALKARYSFSDTDTAFLDAFANLPRFDDVAHEIVQDGLDRAVEPASIRRAASLFQAYEKMFWDTMAAAADVQN